MLPTRAPAYGARLIVLVTVPLAVSTTLTSSLSPFATNSVPPSRESTSALGCVPTWIVLVTVGVAPPMSSTETVLAPWLET